MSSFIIPWLGFIGIFLVYLSRVRRSPENIVAAPLILSFLLIYVFVWKYFGFSEAELRLFLSPHYYLLTLIYALLGLVLFCYGHEEGCRSITKKAAFDKKLIDDKVLQFRKTYSLILGAVGLAGLAIFLHLSGGFMAFYSAAHGTGGAWVTTSAYIHSLPNFLWPAMLMLYWLWERSDRKSNSALYPLLLIVGILFVHTYLMGNRNGVIRLALFLGGSYIFIKRPRGAQFATLLLIFSTCIGIVVLFPHIRSATHLGSETSVVDAVQKYLNSEKKSAMVVSTKASGDELFYNVAVVQGVTESGKVGYGAQYIYVGINFIPRFLWPEKPYRAEFGLSAKDTAEQAVGWRIRNGAAINAVGHSFIEFWWFGCLLWAAIGYWCGRAFEAAKLNPSLDNLGLFLALDLGIVYWATQSFTAFFLGWFFVAIPFVGLRLLEPSNISRGMQDQSGNGEPISGFVPSRY